MSSDTPEPQDPVRFSKAKSEPPILDLEAEKPASASEASQPKAEQPKHDTLRIEKQPPRKLPISGFLGGLIGGGIVALGVLAYAQITDSTATQIATLESALVEKADRHIFSGIEKRLAEIEAALAETQAGLGAIAEKRAIPDADVMKRIATLENAIRSLGTSSPQAVMVEDRRALRLALILSLRDTVRNNLAASREIAALEQSGENSTPFTVLKTNLASPLVPFDEIRTEIERLTKSAPVEEPASPEQSNTASRASSFFSQFVTVRPVGPVARPVSPDTSFAPLLDAVDQDDAKAALAALATVPESDAKKFKSVESELKRRLAVETALAQLLDTALDAIAKGDAP